MSQSDVYTQVELKAGARSYVVWVPQKFGVIRKVLAVDGQPGKWEVVAVYATKTREYLDGQRQTWRCFDDVLDR